MDPRNTERYGPPAGSAAPSEEHHRLLADGETCSCVNPGYLTCAIEHGYWPGGES